MKKKRVVITGMGVVSANGTGLKNYNQALKAGRSGVSFQQESEKLNFGCQVAGNPKVEEDYKNRYLPDMYQKILRNNGIMYGCMAGMEAWLDAGLEPGSNRLESMGMVFGSGATGMDDFNISTFESIDAGKNRILGTTIIPQSMNSGTVAYLNNLLGLGGPAISNSSACTTGSEALLIGYEQIQLGKSEIMLCGSSEGSGRYIWGAFDSMRILCSDSNDNPTMASRPMSASSSGFVPAAGAGALVIETLESAQKRGARIYAELLGGHNNCGGMRNGGSLTAPNADAAVQCIQKAMQAAGIQSEEIDLISGHLTSTRGDPAEIAIWRDALNLSDQDFPYINTPKSMIGHGIAAAGSIESIACVLQMENHYIHGNLNLTQETIHPKIAAAIPIEKIPLKTVSHEINTVIKSNFGFGDVNCCLVFRKFTN